MARTLLQSQIASIKQLISCETGRFTFDITDQEVWDRVQDTKDVEEFRQGRRVSWDQAADMSMDDWGTCFYLGYC